jgi:hypothetical protein
MEIFNLLKIVITAIFGHLLLENINALNQIKFTKMEYEANPVINVVNLTWRQFKTGSYFVNIDLIRYKSFTDLTVNFTV